MTFKELRKRVKEEQKQLAKDIRRGKYLRKPSNRTDITDDDKNLYYHYGDFETYMVEGLSWNYRHYHVAYCTFFNNTPYNLIESSPAKGPDTERIRLIKEGWESEIETVCDSS